MLTADQLSQIRVAWQQAKVSDVERALRNPGDYPTEVLPLIQEEADRRGISAPELQAEPTPKPRIRRSWSTTLVDLASWKPWLTAVLVGTLVPMAGLFLGRLELGPYWPIVSCIIIGTHLAGLALAGMPHRRYGTAIQVGAIAGACFAILATANFAIMYAGEPHFSIYYLILNLVVLFVAFSGVACILLCFGIFYWNWKWPIPRVGSCPKCGYDLRGLLELRCPECGTPFDPAIRRLPEI